MCYQCNSIFINVSFDLDNNQRIVDGDGNGTATVDMGAYEFQIEYPHDSYLPVLFR